MPMAYRRPRLPAACGHWLTTCWRRVLLVSSSHGVSQKRMPFISLYWLTSPLALYKCEVAYTGTSPAYWKFRVGLICWPCCGVAARKMKSMSWRRDGWAETAPPTVFCRLLARPSLWRSWNRSAICWARATG
ncbi:hypothetical protein D3C77_543400 [compost metagenome]